MAVLTRQRGRAGIALAAGAASLALIACGGSGSGSDSEQQASSEDAQLEFAQCMRENGVEDFPDPEAGQQGFAFSPGEGGVDPSDEGFQEASEQCGSILDDAVPSGELPDSAEIEDQLLELTQCLRDEGFDVPDPQIAELGEGGPPPIDEENMERMQELMEDPDFQQAQRDCQEETGLELGGPGGPAGGEG